MLGALLDARERVEPRPRRPRRDEQTLQHELLELDRHVSRVAGREPGDASVRDAPLGVSGDECDAADLVLRVKRCAEGDIEKKPAPGARPKTH